MPVDVIAMLERMAENGTAPEEGCNLFGVGYEEAFQRIKKKYLIERFEKGGSSEKFIIGPFGSGKTHFMRQLMEIGRDLGCVTAEVALNKDIDFVQNLLVYQEIAREIRLPGMRQTGMDMLLRGILEKLREQAFEAGCSTEAFTEAWVNGLDESDFELDAFGRVAKYALEAEISGNHELFKHACRWLSGEMQDKSLAKLLSVNASSKSETGLLGRRAMLTLFQFIHNAGYPGTIIGFDEAEQGLTVDRKKTEKIHSILQSLINALADLRHGSALVLYAVTPEIVEKMENFPALHQRVSDPPGMGFFDGNTLAPKIDLRLRKDPEQDLQAIAGSIAELFFKYGKKDFKSEDKERVLQEVTAEAIRITEQDISASTRRDLVKIVCVKLIAIHDAF